MKISQTYPPALIATHTNDSAPQKPKSARRGLMQRLGLSLLACMLVIGATEAQQAVNGTTQAAFSNYRVRFIKPDVAVVDALLTVHSVNGPDRTIIPVIPINFFYVAVRHGDRWLIQDGRTHFAAAPPSNMTKPSN